MATRFKPAPAPRPIPAARRHVYEYDPDTKRCKECPLPKSNKRMHIPSRAQLEAWSDFDAQLLGEHVS